jgi:hypothetical protein
MFLYQLLSDPADREQEQPVALLDEPDGAGALAAGHPAGDGELDLAGVLQGDPEVFERHASSFL